jgi:hypothetical protein
MKVDFSSIGGKLALKNFFNYRMTAEKSLTRRPV